MFSIPTFLFSSLSFYIQLYLFLFFIFLSVPYLCLFSGLLENRHAHLFVSLRNLLLMLHRYFLCGFYFFGSDTFTTFLMLISVNNVVWLIAWDTTNRDNVFADRHGRWYRSYKINAFDEAPSLGWELFFMTDGVDSVHIPKGADFGVN